MIHVIICDDDADFSLHLKNAITAILKRKNISANILVCNSAEEIGRETLSSCDVAFLDVDFKGKNYNGIDIARELRGLRNDAVIVFVTNYVEFAPEGYEVQAFRYLLKNELPQKLEANVEQIIGQLRTEKSDIKIHVDGEPIALSLRNILFVESMGHTVIFHVLCKDYMPDREYACYGAIGKMEEELAGRGFLRCQKSYLVNMAHIRKFNSSNVLLSDGRSLPVSGKSYADCKRQYLLWKGNHVWNM